MIELYLEVFFLAPTKSDIIKNKAFIFNLFNTSSATILFDLKPSSKVINIFSPLIGLLFKYSSNSSGEINSYSFFRLKI